MQKFKLMATCAAGLEALTANELKQLGYQVQTENGHVMFSGTIVDVIKANLWLRTADRVEIVVGSFSATSFTELFDNVEKLPWETLIPLTGAFPVAGRSQKSQLHSVPDIQAITKKAIVAKLSNYYARHTRLPETGATYAIETRLVKNQATVLLDTTGDSLFKRGYRVAKGAAPLKENMAAALILLTNWQPKTMPFVDPMCGSGTLPIEAALIARNLAPGLQRSFACEAWDWVNPTLVDQLRDEADQQADYTSEFQIFASDVNGEMINYAKVNAQEIGLLHDIHFKQLAVQDFHTDLHHGVVVSNPPYGQRLGDQQQAVSLYHDLGKVFIPLTTWSKYFLTSDLNFETEYGMPATKRRKLYNGRIRTDYFQFWGKRNESGD